MRSARQSAWPAVPVLRVEDMSDFRINILLAAQHLCGYHPEATDAERYELGDWLFRWLDEHPDVDGNEQDPVFVPFQVGDAVPFGPIDSPPPLIEGATFSGTLHVDLNNFPPIAGQLRPLGDG